MLLSSLLLLTILLSDLAVRLLLTSMKFVLSLLLLSSLMLTVSLHAVAGYTTFASFCWRPYCVGRLLVAFISVVASFLLFLAVKLLQSSLLLLVAGFTTVACIPAVDGNLCC